MSASFSITVPDHIHEIVQLIAKEKGLSQSAACVFLMEKGVYTAIEEFNKIEYAKSLIARRDSQG